MHVVTIHDKKNKRSQTFAALKLEEAIFQADEFLAEQGIDDCDKDFPGTVSEVQTDAETLLREAYSTLNMLGDGIGDLLSSMEEEEKFGFEVEAAERIDATLRRIASALNLPFRPILEDEDDDSD